MTPKSPRGNSKAGTGTTAAPAKFPGMNGVGEFRSGPIAGTALVNGATFDGKWLHYANVEGQAIFEGDIVLGPADGVSNDEGGNPVLFSIGITGQQFRWPNGRVPFEIDPALPNQQRVTDAIAHWHANTDIRFVARAGEVDFVRFVSGSGCSSNVGRRGGQQNITLGSSCSTGNAIHEMGHTVGLWHEQSREDRNNFVNVIFANIDPAMQFNFNQQISDGDDLGAYDFGSVMHYPATAFSINGQATIVPRQPLPPGVVMGQRNGLSAGDIAGVRALYPNLNPTIKEVRKDPITDTITKKEVQKDPIQDPIQTLKEVRKDPITDVTIKEVRKDPIADPITRKEVVRDQIGPIFPTGPFPFGDGVPGMQANTPFILAGASRVAQQDTLAEASEQVQQLAIAHTQAQEQADALAAAYEQAVATLSQMGQS